MVIIIRRFCNKAGCVSVNCDQAIRKEAIPPNPLNKATISGIAVIFTFSAITEPIKAPKIIAEIIIVIPISTSISVTETADNMATEESILPRTAVDSLPSILIPKINRTEETI